MRHRCLATRCHGTIIAVALLRMHQQHRCTPQFQIARLHAPPNQRNELKHHGPCNEKPQARLPRAGDATHSGQDGQVTAQVARTGHETGGRPRGRLTQARIRAGADLWAEAPGALPPRGAAELAPQEWRLCDYVAGAAIIRGK